MAAENRDKVYCEQVIINIDLVYQPHTDHILTT